jgi:glycoside/pentoside/hexuronide:cation symporter, GPH family
MTDTLPTGVRAGYSLGSLVTGAFGTVPGLLLLPYLTDSLGVAAGVGGLLVLLPKAWDVLVNPVAGRISDRTVSRLGPRRPYLLGAGLAVAVLFALIFAGPFGHSAAAPVWVTALFLLTATGYAFFQVPYVAMPAEMTDSYAERTRLMTWRVAVLALAILVSGGVAPIVVDAGGKGIPGHRLMGLFVGALIVVGTLGVFLGTRRAPVGELTESEPTLRAQLAVARRNRPFVLLLGCFVIQAAGIATMLAGVNYFAEQVMRSDAAKTLLFVCFVAPALLVMPVWRRVGERYGKLYGYVLASLLFVAGALLLAVAHVGALAYLWTLLIGAGYAGQQVFGLAMLPDCVAWDAARTGRRQAGVFTGLWTAGETFGLALGPGVFGLMLQLFGYVSSSSGTALAQSGTARLGITLGFTVLPAIVVVAPLALLRRYDLTPARLREAAATAG